MRWKVNEQEDGSIDITSGSYILHINPAYEQTSGVYGATFAEISKGVPSAELVTQFQPAMECTTPTQSVTKSLKRYNVHTNGDVNPGICVPTTDGTERWYMSYYVKESPYVSYISDDSSTSYVITFGIDVDSVENLPESDSIQFKRVLKQVDRMVDSLVIK